MDDLVPLIMGATSGWPRHLHVGASVVRQEAVVLLAEGPLKQTFDPCTHD
jgi:hypothetical protein